MSVLGYAGRSVARRYSRRTILTPAEELIFREWKTAFSGRVLDIGVGAGRTTGPLLRTASQYVGLDLSPHMIAAARRRFPSADLRLMDMRRVPEIFAGDEFDVILSSFNAIDYIEWDDRNRLLAGLRGILAETGLLVFSTHCLDSHSGRPRRFEVPMSAQLTLRNLFSEPLAWAKVPLRRLW